MGISDDDKASLLGLCGAQLPELDGLGANNQIEISQVKVKQYSYEIICFDSQL